MADVDDARDSDRARRRRSDVQGKLYNFLNRSAQSLSRSNSQAGRSRGVKDNRDKELPSNTGADQDSPRAPHATASRLPIGNGSASETSRGGLFPPSARTSRSAAGTLGTDLDAALQPRKSSSPPSTPQLQHKHTLSSAHQSKTSTVVYPYNTPPQTPSRSRNYSNASSATGAGRDLLLNRPLARPITPTNSSSNRKVFGIPIPSPSTPRKTALEVDEGLRRHGHRLREGSGSSNEPLLYDRSPSHESGRTALRPSTSTGVSTPRATPRPNRTSRDQTPLPTPSSSLPRSQRSALSALREEPPASPTPSSRRGTPRLDFWRSITPRAPSSQGDREKEKDKRRVATPDASREEGQAEQPGLVSPQPRAPATFLPRFQRTPATPRRGEEAEGSNTVRLDSFMSDSLPVQQAIVQPPGGGDQPSGLTRQPAFSGQRQNDQPRTPRTPGPERKAAPAVSIQRSNSAPGIRGRLSPCLRIPSPKFLTRERSKDRDKEKEKEGDKGMHHEKRRVTPESVGAPIIREPPRTTYLHAHNHTHSHAHANVAEKGPGAVGGLKAPKTSLIQLRRGAHGTFDFERPGSRTSSKSGQSGSRDTDDEREKELEREKEKENREELDNRRLFTGRSPRPQDPIRRAPSPVPPLPTPSSRLKPHSPPVRTRSPLGINANPPPSATSHTHSHSHSHATHIDDSALPRLSNSLARRNTATSSNAHSRSHAHGHGHRSPASLPHFSFEPAAPPVPTAPAVPPKPIREGGGQYIDTRTGLIMYAPKEDNLASSRRSGTPRRAANANVNGYAHAHAAPEGPGISPHQLEEATAVITQFKNALDDAGFATLQKYVRHYDSKIIPLDGAAGLLTRVQRLLETSAPRIDKERKRQLYESFVRVVSQVS